jgi:hypothetical protein
MSDDIQEMLFIFLIGEKLTKINLIHMSMFHIDDKSIMGIFFIDSSTSMRLSHLKLAEISNLMKILY